MTETLKSIPLPAFSIGITNPSTFVSYTRFLLGGSCGLLWKQLLSTAGLSNPRTAMPVVPTLGSFQHQDPE